MKKLLALVLATVMLSTLVACGNAETAATGSADGMTEIPLTRAASSSIPQ